MSMYRAFRSLCAIASLALSCSGNAAPPQTVEWTDDFLGLTIDAKYCRSVSGTGRIDLATFTGGAARIYVLSSGLGNARLRFGEESGTGCCDVRNWNPTKNLLFEARAFFNLDADVQITVGLVGQNDPNNVLAALLIRTAGSGSSRHDRRSVARSFRKISLLDLCIGLVSGLTSR